MLLCSSGDWRALAGKVGYSTQQIILWSDQRDGCEAFLHDWQTRNESTVGNLARMLSDMGHIAVNSLCRV